MKILLGYVYAISLLLFSPNGGEKKNEYVYHVTFDQNTRVIINGSSNVSDFACAYTGNFKNQTYCIYGDLNGMVMKLRNADFSLEVGKFDCGNPIMTGDFKRTLKKDDFPEISMEIKTIDFVCKESLSCKSSMVFANIQVTAAGESKDYCIKAQRNLVDSGVHFAGSFDINVIDFGIDPPTHAFGLVKVEPTMQIEFSFVFNEMSS